METEVVKIMSIDYDEGAESLLVEVPLPHARKDTIDLEVYRDWFSLRALRDDREEAEYMGVFNLCCPVDGASVTARFTDGVLSLNLPLDEGAVRPRTVRVD